MEQKEIKTHRKFAVDCFNDTWDLIDNKDRSHEEDLKMIHSAHASRYHWGEIGTPLEFARGDWQISRVYAILGDGTSAVVYAQESLNHCLNNDIGDFDLAFAYEALARASAVMGNEEKYFQFYEKAKEAADDIEEENNRNYFLKELDTIKKESYS